MGHFLPEESFSVTVDSLDAWLLKATIRQTMDAKELKSLRESFAAGLDF